MQPRAMDLSDRSNGNARIVGEKSTDTKRWCPSAPCHEGAVLLGVVGSDGIVGYVTPRVRVTHDFVNSARQGRSPQSRFRFAQPCVQNACAQWRGARCGLIDDALGTYVAQVPAGRTNALPACSIRTWCQWFSQRGASACEVCPLVITKPENVMRKTLRTEVFEHE